MSVNLYKLLCNAVTFGDAQNVKYFLEVRHVDPNPREDERDSPLLIACRNKNLGIVKLLITNWKHPADPNEYHPDQNDRTPFIVALKSENMELINLLLNESILKVQVDRIRISVHIRRFTHKRKVSIDSTVTALILAVKEQNVPLVKSLLHAGANSNLTTEGANYFPLVFAIRCGNVDICRELFRYGCDPNAIPVTNICRAIRSSYKVSTQAVNLLIEQGDFAMRHQDILLDLFIKQHCAENLEHCLQHIYNKLGEKVQGWKKEFVQTALSCGDTNSLRVLLRWGFYTHHHTFHSGEVKLDDRRFDKYPSIYTPLILKLLRQFNPMCLQESWFMNGKITQLYLESGDENKMVTITELMEARKNPPSLQLFCRTTIIQHLSYNPLWKAQKLPLPKVLKEYVQLKNVDIVHGDAFIYHRKRRRRQVPADILSVL